MSCPLHILFYQDDESITNDSVKAKLSNLPEDTDEDFLNLYFEELLGSDVGTMSIELNENGTEAVIEFQNKEGIEIIINTTFY